ncbi:MAG: SH3 domain-containing protein [Chloroflexota bacterium]
MQRHNWLWIMACLLLTQIPISTAQTNNLAATVTIVADGVMFSRNNTEQTFMLPVGSVTPFGIGDNIETNTTGRAIITLADGYSILLLPDSVYSVQSFDETDPETFSFAGTLEGIAIHDFAREAITLSYQLNTSEFDVMSSSNTNFATWASEDYLQAVTVASGDITLLHDDHEYIVESGEGFAMSYSDEPVSLQDEPYHGVHAVRASIDCQGTINTTNPLGVRVRSGASLAYIDIAVVLDGTPVDIVAIGEDERWYRVTLFSEFGWVFTDLVEAECEGLPELPFAFPEMPERLLAAADIERPFLLPYYGDFFTNPNFYTER